MLLADQRRMPKSVCATTDILSNYHTRQSPHADHEHVEREVKKANRDLSQLLSNMESMPSKVDALQRKYSELLAEMKRTEREHIKSKKRGDQLQKEKDSQRSELTKSNSMKEKLEKLSRELTKENKKLKVRISFWECIWFAVLILLSYIGGSARTQRKRRR